MKSEITKEDLEKLVGQFLTIREISALTSIDHYIISKLLKGYGLKTFPKSKQPLLVVTKEQLQECIDLGYGEKRTSKKLGITQQTYRRWMNFYSLKSNCEERYKKQADHLQKCVSPNTCEICNQNKCRDTICKKCSSGLIGWGIKFILFEHCGGKCAKCGCDDFRIMEFHHLNPSEKSFSIGGSFTYKDLKLVKEELKKCAMLCHNCHHLEHVHQKSFHPLVKEKFERIKEKAKKIFDELP